MSKKGCLFIVATPIGNRDDITARALQVLREVDRVAAEDTRHSGALLHYYGIHKPQLSLHQFNESRQSERLLEYLEQGESIALVSDAGTPLVSDPGYRLLRQVHEAGIALVPIPGPCALIAALSVAGMPAERFVFEGFLPAKAGARQKQLQEIKNERRTLVFYESPHRILESLTAMADIFGDERQAVVARELTKMYETLLQGTLAELVHILRADANQCRGEFVVIVAGDDTGPIRTDADAILKILLRELPVKQASELASRITGERKNSLYRRALAMSKGDD